MGFATVLSCALLVCVAAQPSDDEVHELLLRVAPQNDVGTRTQCIGGRAHVVKYNVDPSAESLSTCRNCLVSVRPTPWLNEECDGSSQHASNRSAEECFGANVDSATCKDAHKKIKLGGLFSCSKCFLALQMDFELSFAWVSSWFGFKNDLTRMTVAARNVHIRGALQVTAEIAHKQTLLEGEVVLPFSPEVTVNLGVVSFPMWVKMSMPMTMGYKLSLQASASLMAGVTMDLQVSDMETHWVNLPKSEGGGLFVKQSQFQRVDFEPVLKAPALDKLGAFLDIGASAGLQIEVDSIFQYKISLAPTLPIKVACTWNCRDVCATAEAKFSVEHAAEIHFPGLVDAWDVTLWSYGPTTLYSWSKELAKTCLSDTLALPTPESLQV